MFEYAGGEWPERVPATIGKVTEKPAPVLFDHPDLDLWTAQEITSNAQEAKALLFMRWRYEQGEFNES